ncbi:HAMP domain-containing histidine kinase [Pseudenhygromyxa sp. WMMC2535]|uniref:sensor histidine kinase n=1 Tax=Pseudenhygromyxa sp. WMMC2535 TaxID=2712867 RepID=UPI001555FAEE|nr:HAMP domain-containing sensor histidine kinase [Pseudenhygromyxa sp. WMMC2535]NVB37046.1 HAMP domain-containing histidine kinase [Pseudenhygromyxa sp. WMMC2535]
MNDRLQMMQIQTSEFSPPQRPPSSAWVLSAIVHELRQPLSNLLAVLELGCEGRGLDAGDLEALLGEVKRMGALLDGTRALVRPLRAPPQDVGGSLAELAGLFRWRAAELGLGLDVQVAQLPALPFDAALLRTLLSNLLTNACEACDVGGRIRVEVGFDASGQALRLAVIDDGCGMSPAQIARCRQRYVTDKRGGTGVGLALVQELVGDAGGALRITSKVDQGTTVEIVLPI